MNFRMKAKHYWGVSRNDNQVDQAPIPGCAMYEERLEAWQETERTGTQGKRGKRPKNTAGGPTKRKQANAPVAITLQLNHGDVVVMHGEKIQEYYEVLYYTPLVAWCIANFHSKAFRDGSRKAPLCSHLPLYRPGVRGAGAEAGIHR
jgi:hypothetical protein